MFNKKLYITIITIISILILSISCGNSITDSTNGGNGENNGGSISGGGGTNSGGNTTVKTTVQYGSQSAMIDTSNYEEVKKLWLEVFANKDIYSSEQLNTKTGWTDVNGNYFENSWESGKSARTEHRTNVVITFNNKNYIAGIYWDNKTGIGMQIRYRLIVIDDAGVEHAWYGGGSDANIIPNENTTWTYYTFRFGYLKNY